MKLHEEIISFGSEMQSKSSIKLEQESHIPNNVQAFFYKINAYGIILHRAIKTLCESGWTHVTPCLLRTIMECSANCLAIINNEYPEYMAFKYFYKEYVKILRDERTSDPLKEKNLIDINQGIEHIADLTAKEKANRFVAEGNVNRFWFKPEEAGVSNIIEDYGSRNLIGLYGDLSMSVHAGHLGLFLFKDDPDDIEINPCENPRGTKLVIPLSCRLLLELLLIRNSYEKLGLDSEYERLYERLMSFK